MEQAHPGQSDASFKEHERSKVQSNHNQEWGVPPRVQAEKAVWSRHTPGNQTLRSKGMRRPKVQSRHRKATGEGDTSGPSGTLSVL